MPATRRKNKRDHSATTNSSPSASSNKRKSKTVKSKKSPRSNKGQSATNTNNNNNTKPCLLITLLNQLDTIAQSKPRSVAAIQAISKATILHSKMSMTNTTTNTATNTTTNTNNATATTSSSSSKKNGISSILSSSTNEAQCNANLIIIATHILNRIMTHLNTLTSDDTSNSNSTSDDKNNSTTNTHSEEIRQFAMVLCMYGATLAKILLADKTQLERTINANAASSRTSGYGHGHAHAHGSSGLGGGSHAGTGGGGGDLNHMKEEGFTAKSILGRAILSCMLSSLKSMHLLSTVHLPSTSSSATTKTSTTSTSTNNNGTIYSKLMWKNTLILERLLALGVNYRSIRSNHSKGSKISSIQSSASVLSTNANDVLAMSSSGGVGGVGGVGSSGVSGVSGSSHVCVSSNSVHTVNMDASRANAWNEICTAMEAEEDLKSGQGGTSASTSTSGSNNGAKKNPSVLLVDDAMVEALTHSNQTLFFGTGSTSTMNMNTNTNTNKKDGDDSGDGDVILQLITFETQNTSKKEDNKKKEEDSSTNSKSVAKRRRIESSSSSTAARTRSRVLSDKNDNKDDASNEQLATLSTLVSDVIFSFDFNNIVIGGNRFTLKKWSSTAFAWVCGGQEIGLQTVRNMLLAVLGSAEGDDHDPTTNWNDIMNISTFIPSTSPTRRKGKSSPSERKRASGASAKNKGCVINIPGNLVLITFASRIIDIVNEGGKMAGNTLQRNGMDNYVNFFRKNVTAKVAAATTPISKSSGSTAKSRRQPARKTRESASTAILSASPDVKADVVMSSGSKSKSNSGSSKLKRTDIRNLSIALMELLLRAHQVCIENNVAIPATQGDSLDESIEITYFNPKYPLENGETLGQILLNEDEDTDGRIVTILSDQKKDLQSSCRYFPLIHKTIDTLIKCASSIALSIGGIEDCMTRLTGIGSALALKYSTLVSKSSIKEMKQQKKGPSTVQGASFNTISVVDAKLCSWAVHQLAQSVGNIITSPKQLFSEEGIETQINDISPELVQCFSLDKTIALSDQIISGSTASDYLGLYESNMDSEDASSIPIEQDQQRLLHGRILALFLRMMLPTNKKDKDGSTKAMLGLTKTLLRIIGCCYSIETKTTVNINTRRGTFTRFTLAADCIDTLRKCLSFAPSMKTKALEPNLLLHSLIRRFSLTPVVLCCFVELGNLLEQNIIRQRVEIFGETNNPDSHNEKSASLLPSQNFFRLEFEQWERRLWSSHVKLCLVISRGYTEFESRSLHQKKTQSKSYLGNCSNKLALFKAIAAVCDNHDKPHTSWPLYLPSIHHALITSSLISDPLPRTVKDAAAERFVCDKLLQSISDALVNPGLILDKAREQKKSNIQVSDEEFPLSLRDSRLFVIALCRLPKKDQHKLLSKLVSSLSSDITKIKKDDELRKLLVIEKDYAGFLARIVTVTSILVDVVSAGKPLLDSLCDCIGPLHYYLPSIIEVDSESDLEGSDWYKKESCFMGLWEEWESSALPIVEVSNYSEALSKDEVSKLASTLELALEFGFDSAPEDKCLLLFAAWNASGKLCAIGPKSWGGPSTLEDFNKISIPLKLFRIRDDVCNLYQEFDLCEKSVPDTFLSKQLKRKEEKNGEKIGSTSGSKGILQLRCALSSSLDILKDMLNSSVCDKNHRTSSSDFAMFETSVAYTSFLISMFTTSGTDFLSAIIPRDKNSEDRKRKGSSISADSYDDDASEDSVESESGYNDFDDDDDDAKSDGISRFHEICEELGAAPIHPDWLDINCRLRAGIAKSTAVEVAELALRVLTDFGSNVFNRYVQSLNAVLCNDKSETSESVSPFHIINSMVHGIPSAGWHEAVGDLYNIDTNMVALFETGLPCKNISVVKEAWAPNSAHRIRGKLQNTMSINGWAVSSAELRSGAEWEILLSDALLGACSDIDYRSCNPEMRKKFHETLRWGRVLHSTISAIITSAALLRFSLNDGKGRTRHHLNNFESNQENKDKWYQSSPIYRFPSYGDFSTLSVSPEQLDSTVCKSLYLLSDIQSNGALSADCQLSAQAATCHLVGSDDDLQVIVEVKKIRNSLLGLQSLSEYVRSKDMGNCVESANSIVGKIIQSEHFVSDEKFLKALLFSLGSPIDLNITTLAKSGHKLMQILCCDFEKDSTHFASWQWGLAQHKSISILVQMMQGQLPIELSGNARLKIIQMVKGILIAEEKTNCGKDDTVKQLFLEYWNKAKEDDLNELVLRDICLRDAHTPNPENSNKNITLEISRNLSSTIAYLSGGKTEKEEKTGANRLIFQTLRSNAKSWMMNEGLDHVLCLLYLLSVCHSSVGEVGDDLLGYLDEYSDERKLCALEMFYKFLCDSKKRLRGGDDITMIEDDIDAKKDGTQGFPNKSEKGSFGTKSGEIKKRCCTYVSTNGNFTEQHWYNCYTCGLLWDKGCCSLCAQICHKGHDVGYSRKSSFFCDCGADSGTDCDRARCKCLSPLSDETLSSIHTTGLGITTNNENLEDDDCRDVSMKDFSFWNEATSISATNFPTIFIFALDKFVESINSKIIGKLFGVFNKYFEAWAEKDSIHLMTNIRNGELEMDRDHSLSLASRSGKHAEASQLDEKVFSVVRVFKSNTVNAKISNETNIDRRKKLIMSKNSIERKILVTDKRGRMIISEPGSLLFCAGLSLANVRHQLIPSETQLQRSELCVLGSSKVKSNIIGMALSPDDDSRLVAWGTSDAYVFIISEFCDRVESVIELEVGLDLYDCETDYIVKIEWLFGSSGNVIVVFCATSVKIFDIHRTTVSSSNDDNEFTCQPVSSYTLAYEDVVIKAGTVVPSSNKGSSELNDCNLGAKIAILFDTGRLQFIDVNLDFDESIEDKGEFNIGYGEGLSFPIAGIRRKCSSVEPEGATAKSLGEGVHLEYLYQSQILLYKCTSSPMVAFILDKSGSIIGSFEFLPHILNKEMLGSTVNGYSITGPYTHWTELGIVRREGSSFYRASFVGRSTRMNQPKLMYVEFNEEYTRLEEVKTPANSLALGLNASIEGSVAFSAPILNDSSSGMISSESNKFYERIFLASISSNGSIMLFGEELDKCQKDGDGKGSDLIRPEVRRRRRAFSDTILSHNKREVDAVGSTVVKATRKAPQAPTFPLTIFEELINMSERPEVVFGGDSVKDPDVIKRRLSMSSGEFVISPSKDGCTLTVSLRPPDRPNKAGPILSNVMKERTPISHERFEDSNNVIQVENLATVAVRILLGSTTTDYLPKEIAVMGRQIKMTQRMKRWYDVPLTDEEIILGIRSGVVTISIGASSDATKSPPLIDSVEVYAQERSKLSHLFPIQTDNNLNFDENGMTVTTEFSNEEQNRKSLDTSILAITHMFNLLGNKVDLSSQISLQTLRRLIQVTALDSPKDGNVRNRVIDLVKSVQKNPQSMQMLLDEGTLQGISNMLKDFCFKRLDSSSVPFQWRDKVLSKLKDCLHVTLLIAKDRPVNYKNAIENLILSGQINCSIALQAKQILDIFTNKAYAVKTTSQLIQLALFESMATEGCSNENFADLQLVTEILHCEDESIVKESCIKLAETLKEVQSFGKVQAYQCDGCSAFPITGTRYTLEDKNIDLCKKCFECGNKYARLKSFRPGFPVLVDGKKLQMEDDKVMTCSQIRQMTTKLVPANILEQVNEANALREDVVMDEVDDDDDDDVALKNAIKMSLETQTEEAGDPELHRTSSYTIHMSVISTLLEDIEKSLSSGKEDLIRHPIPVIDLLLTLVVQSDSPEDQLTFGKKVCDVLCCNMFSLIESYCCKHSTQGLLKRNRFAMLIYLRALEGLATKQESILGIMKIGNTYLEQSEVPDKQVPVIPERSKDKTDPRFVCESHGVPAVRRRCSHGNNKDRRFYVCGMDRKQRCKYFKWADEEDSASAVRSMAAETCSTKQSIASAGSSDELSAKVDPELHSLIWNILNDKKRPLQQRLCSLLQTFLKKLDCQGNDTVNTGKTSPDDRIAKFHAKLKTNKMRDLTRKKEFNGIYFPLSKSAVSYRYGDPVNQLGHCSKVAQLNANEYSVVEASLDLLSKIAMNALRGSQNPQSSWEGWFSLLCEIISSSTSSHLQSQAKKMMKRLCGGRGAIYHQIRDRYVFGFQFMKLLLHCEAPLQAAIDVREKARRCGSHWRLADLTWATLPVGGLIGTQELISEDNYAVLKLENVSKILDDLINTARTRGNNWSHFCALDKMPQKNNSETEICERSPICLLFWMACSLPHQNQIKVFKLMEIALSLPLEKEQILSSSSVGEDSIGIMSTDGGTDFETSPSGKQNHFSSDNETPQQVLLGGASGLSIDDIHAFIISFILNGEDIEVRRLASNICLKILTSTPKMWIDALLKRFISILVSDLGYLGCEAVEFLQFLHYLVSNNQIMVGIDVSSLFQATATFFTQQLKALRDAKLSAGKEATLIKLASIAKNDQCQTFDFATCAHCQKIPCCDDRALQSKNSSSEITDNDRNEGEKRKSGIESNNITKRRLDTSTLSSVSSEFSCHVQLKFRLTITEVCLNVSDPRGRFAKTVGIFFSPRPVRNVNELKSPEYTPFWQRCGTLTIPRGGSRASCKLKFPIVAANLKFEYEEFYEKINSSRPSGSGGMVIHCPRCTRVVNNAHGGVCGNCGEVAFQCRKCRHINYDRLDAFLCVECGYCSSGSFSYEISASQASRAVAVIDDEGLERAVRLMWVAGNKYNEYKGMLMKTLQNSKSLSGHKRSRGDTDGSISKLNGPLKRALLGDLPKINFKSSSGNSSSGKKKRSIVSENLDSTNRAESFSGSSSAANRARSLLNLAIQLRSESGNEERASLGDVPDSLSRLVANIARVRNGNNSMNRRSRDEENDDKRDLIGDGSDGEPSAKVEESSKKVLQSCEKLYQQMRDVEKDNFEFRRRVIAWKRLNHDALANHGREAHLTNCIYDVSFCSSCSPTILKHLLALVHVLFRVRNATLLDTPLNKDFISLLFDEGNDNFNTDLNRLKRDMIVALATKSALGSDMVFGELQMRLQGSRNVACADILGELLAEEDVRSPDKFVELAMQTLK